MGKAATACEEGIEFRDGQSKEERNEDYDDSDPKVLIVLKRKRLLHYGPNVCQMT